MSVKLAHSLEVNKTVIVTWANNALLDFVLSWVKHMRKLGGWAAGAFQCS
jgi:hypothetical protein